MDNAILNRLLSFVVRGVTMDIVARANGIQSVIDNYINRQSLSMDANQIMDLIQSGQISVVQSEVDSMSRKAQQLVEGAVNVSYQSGVTQYLTENSKDDDMYRWVSKKSGSKNCPDCKSRDGEVQTWAMWRDVLGMPCSSFSICTSRCRCRLVKVVR